MKETWTTKVKCFARRIIKKISGHEYDCCNKLLYPCRNCHWVAEKYNG